MKTKQRCILPGLLLGIALLPAAFQSQAQTKVLANGFVNADEVADTARNGGDAWQNWYGTAFYRLEWDPSDSSNNVNSGSLKIEAYFPDSGIGGNYGAQFYVINGFNGYTNSTYPQGFPGNGNQTVGLAVATNVEFDIRFDPTSYYDTNNNVWPWIAVGTRGTGTSPLTWGSPYTSYSHDNTNWYHRSIAIPADAGWTNIPNIFFQHYDGSVPGPAYMACYIDNIQFDFAPPATIPTSLPSLTLQPAKPALRLLAGNSQYSRIQVATVDTNQSWVGGSYPVSYSFTISDADATTSLNEFHLFLTPVNYNQGGLGAINQYTDYSTASNNFRLQITGGAVGTPTAYAQLDWKTNLVNANPDHLALRITNSTLFGTWTVTFNSATAGTLSAPGAGPASFSLPADAAATFANPLVAFVGVQPNPTANIGSYVDLTHIQTVGVAAPGVPVNSAFGSSATIDTNVWRTGSVSADASDLIVADSSSAYWVGWLAPDSGAGLAAASTVNAPLANWKTPAYYAGSQSNSIVKKLVGTRTWTLLPDAALPPGNNGFFRLEWPAPQQ